jgi:hypothetical protein
VHWFSIGRGRVLILVLDPLGVLGPREVQIRSSRRNLKNADGPETDIVLGDVLV